MPCIVMEIRCCCCYISVLSYFNSSFSVFKEISSAFPVSNRRDKKRKKERKKKTIIVFSPTQNDTFSVGATETKLEPAATETTVFHRYRWWELLMLFYYLHQWKHYHSRSFEIRWFFSAWNNARYVMRMTNAPSGLARIRIHTPRGNL